MRRKNILAYGAAAGVSLLLVASFALVGGSGCYGDQCIGDGREYNHDTGLTPGEKDPVGKGTFISPDLWESGPQVSTWLHFRAQRTWRFVLRGWEGRRILRVIPYISPNANRADSAEYTIAAGNLANIAIYGTEVPGATPVVDIRNDTCAEYYMRVVVEAYPAEPDAGSPDGGPDDGGSDSSQDGASDTGANE